MDKDPANQTDGVLSLLFRVASHLCALPVTHVVETMRPLPIEALSGAPTAVMGLAVIRGNPLPVLDLSGLLEGQETAATRFVTVRAGQRQIALAVESVLGLRNLPADTFRNIPRLLGEANANAIAAIGTLDAELLLVLNTARLVPDQLWQAISAAAAAS